MSSDTGIGDNVILMSPESTRCWESGRHRADRRPGRRQSARKVESDFRLREQFRQALDQRFGVQVADRIRVVRPCSTIVIP